MGGVNATTPQRPPRPLGLDPVVAGTAYCVVSALCYTAANLCLRKLAVDADKAWTICVKEVVTVAVIGPWLLLQAFRGGRVVPPGRTLLLLALTGLAVQFAGNLPMQWAFGAVGIAVTLPVVFGVMLMSCAVMGMAFLGERVSARSAVAMGILIGSIVLLSVGKVAVAEPDSHEARGAGAIASAADHEQGSTANTASTAESPRIPAALRGLLGLGAGCLTGLMFAALSTVIRFSAAGQVRVTTIVFIITGMGVLGLGSLSVWRLGTQALLQTDPGHFAWMLAAGSFNLIAFLAITKGLQLTTVVHANVLNASQVAMGALAGVMVFRESLSVWLMLGICLTTVGILLADPSGSESHGVEGV